MTKAGRKVHVQYVLTGMVIYLAMVVDLPAWALKAIDKIRRGFFWRSRRDAKGEHCHVAWGNVCRPRELGGIGISSIKELFGRLECGGYGWLKLSQLAHGPLSIQVPEKVKDFFSLALQTELGNGATTLFLSDRVGAQNCGLGPSVI